MKTNSSGQRSAVSVQMLVALGSFFLMTSAAFAADSLPDPNSYAAIGWVVVILLGLATTGATIISAVSTTRFNNRPLPPLYDQFEKLSRESKEGRAKIHTHIETMKHELTATIKAIETDVKEHDRKITALETEVWRR